MAKGGLTIRGSALSESDIAAMKPRTARATDSNREGRQSMGEFDDSLDKGVQLRIVGPFAAHAPLPELIVFAVEQA